MLSRPLDKIETRSSTHEMVIDTLRASVSDDPSTGVGAAIDRDTVQETDHKQDMRGSSV